MATREYTDDEYETLQTSEREMAGNQETAEIVDVRIGNRTARLVLEFDWKADNEHLQFDLDSERDVVELKTLAQSLGYDYDHLPYLEGEAVDATYLDGEWIPSPMLPDGVSTAEETVSTGPGHISVARKRVRERLDGVSGNQLLIAALIFKKLLIAIALVYILVL